MDNPNPSLEERTEEITKYPPTPPKLQQCDIYPASSPHFNDLARESVTPPQIPRVTQPGSQIALTTTTRGCIPSVGATPAFSHTHVVVCNSQACTDQVTTDTRQSILRDPVKVQASVYHAQHPPQNMSPTRHESQQHSFRLEIKRHLQIGDRCYAKFFEDGMFYSAKIVVAYCP